MQKIFNKGHRIRASDKHLVYHFSIGTLLFVFVAVLLLLNIKPVSYTHLRIFQWSRIKSLWQSSKQLLGYQGSLIAAIPTVHSAYRYLKMSCLLYTSRCV